jgi:pimeloyl-ACP methyl ester carboxylesterase
MPYAALGDLDLFYEDLGRRDRPPVLLLHGFTLSGRVCWGPHLGAFGRDYRSCPISAATVGPAIPPDPRR